MRRDVKDGPFVTATLAIVCERCIRVHDMTIIEQFRLATVLGSFC
jgi:hypothetical protein